MTDTSGPQVHDEITAMRDENVLLRRIIADACEVLDHYGIPEHAFHYRRVLAGETKLTVEEVRRAALDELTAESERLGFYKTA